MRVDELGCAFAERGLVDCPATPTNCDLPQVTLPSAALSVHSDIGINQGRGKLSPEGGITMSDQQNLGRRDFLKGAVVGGAAAATGAAAVPQEAAAQAAAAAHPGYSFLN